MHTSLADAALASEDQRARLWAMRSLFEHLESLCEGAVAVDLNARVTWIHEKYVRRFGFASAAQALGQPVEAVIPHSRLQEVVRSGAPIVLDIMDAAGRPCVVMRVPVTCTEGILRGAAGFVLYDGIEGLAPMLAKVERLQERLNAAERELLESRRARYSLASFRGESAPISEVKRLARRAAMLDATVLLTGETGTGKELLAHAIHHLSPRADKPFVSINAAAIPEALLESELFGAAAGAYTGADRRGRDGKFKVADGGTLFLDEIGDMPLSLQAKLLRVLQEQEIEPLGSNRVLRVNVRIIAATSVDLAARVADGRFRADLFYRLDVLHIAVPALRERLSDLPALAEQMLDTIALRIGQPVELEGEALALLTRHDWPGNVRELRNVLERAVMTSESPHRLTVRDLQSALPALRQAASAQVAEPVRSLQDVVADAQRRAIADALAQAQGNRAQAARALGISRAALYQKITALGLEAQG